MMNCKGVIFWAVCGTWSVLSHGMEDQERDMDSPLISHQKESDLISQMERHKLKVLKGQLKDESFTNSVYNSALKELEENYQNLKATHDYMGTFLHFSQGDAKSETSVTQGLPTHEDFLHLIHRLGAFYPHPTTHSQLVYGLNEVPGYFSGHLIPQGCDGLLSGKVSGGEAKMVDNQWFFSMALGKQRFEGSLKVNDAATQLVLKSGDSRSQMTFSLAPEFFNQWTNTRKISSAWQKLLGLKNGSRPAVFYSPSRAMPEGLEVSSPITYPFAVYYHKNEPKPVADKQKTGIDYFWQKICQWIWGDPQPISHEIGRFYVFDETPNHSGKIIFSHHLGQPMVLQAPSGVNIRINTNFDFNKSWLMPMVLWDHYQPIMMSSLHFQHSEFNDLLQESVKKFDAKPMGQVLEKIVLDYLTSDQQSNDALNAIQSLSTLHGVMEKSLEDLSQRKKQLLGHISKNETRIQRTYLEGKMVLSKAGL